MSWARFGSSGIYPDGIRATVLPASRDPGKGVAEVGLELQIRLFVGPRNSGKEYEIGWISGIGDLPTLLREAADLIEGVAADG